MLDLLPWAHIIKAPMPARRSAASSTTHPIAQVFAGENIDLNDFISTEGPDAKQHASNIAADPYAAAKFFHFMITTIIETLFQVKCTKFKVKSEMGILGLVSVYFGTVESQGHGTLHLHLLIWFKNALSFDQMTKFLKSEEFHAQIVAYIWANLQTYLPSLESAKSVKQIQTFLSMLSKNIAIGKQGSETRHSRHSFEGISVIICGDLHQFPPVVQSSAEFLYQPTDPARDPTEQQIR
jgi:hypothetical protein